MIVRIFRAQLKPGRRAAYERLCREVSEPLMRAQPGCQTTHIAPPHTAQTSVFTFVSVWRDLDSLRGFAGERWQEATILPGEADLLETVRVEHYDDAYASLVELWHANAETVRQREATALAVPLTDPQWEAVRDLLPAGRSGGRGRPRADDRRTLDGILYVLRNGCRWHDLPATYGDPVTCWRRFSRWEADGTWERVWRALLRTLEPVERQTWAMAFVDSRRVPTKRRRLGVRA
jgi:transposase/heme-degrading monooxygenase HmoA